MDTIIYVILPILLCIAGLCYFDKIRRDKMKEENSPASTSSDEINITPKEISKAMTELSSLKGIELLRMALHVFGCTLEETESKGDYSTIFQGEYFIIRVEENAWQAMVYDVNWFSVPLDNLDAVSDVRRVINECNHNILDATLFYTIEQNEEDHEQIMAVHTKLSVLLIGSIPDYPSYLRARLEASFQQRRAFHSEMNELRKERASQT